MAKKQLKKSRHDYRPRRAYSGKIPRLTVTLVRHKRLKENPEVRVHLTNMSQRHAGKRPEWFDFEPLKLSSRTRQCKRIYWQILSDHAAYRKRLIVLTADAGMGKTSFLASLYSMLEHAPRTILTLAPVAVKRTPFEMVRNILEQRFYISGTASYDSIKQYVESAIGSMIPGAEGKRICESILNLWRKKVVPPPIPRKKQPPSLQTVVTRMPGMPTADDQEISAFDKETSEAMTRLADALTPLFKADLERNSLVIMLDDAMRYDRASLNLLSRIYQSLPNLPLSFVMTLPSREMLPTCFKSLHADYVALQNLSDEELVQLTQHIIMELSKSREKVIVPEEICRQIAQLSLGSPKHAIQLTLKHYNNLPHYSELLEQLKHTPVRKTVCNHLVARFKSCPESERMILRFASLLNAPFTVSTMESILTTWPQPEVAATDCRESLRQLRRKGFIDKAQKSYGANTTTYVFNLEYERMIIAESASPAIREHVYRTAPQWYALNNVNRRFDEVIGDLWSLNGSHAEASHYYVRAAYSAYRRSQLPKARRLFRKLLSSIPEDNLSRRIQYSLDNADIVFRLGVIDEAFLLCRRASHYAQQISSYAQSARAYIQMASMLIEIGSIRHVRRYMSYARALLNRESDPQTLCMYHATASRLEMLRFNFAKASNHLAQAREYTEQFTIPPHDMYYLRYLEARLEAWMGNPAHALSMYEEIAAQSSSHGDIQIEGLCLCSAGQIHLMIGDITEALESWNRALGLAQEMNDIIMHASLLGDIADSAIALDANRTAQNASEQCMNMAQQTHQKALIARCLGHTASLQLAAGEPDKAYRCLHKSLKSAHALRNRPLCLHNQMLLCTYHIRNASPENSTATAQKLFAHLRHSAEKYPLFMCEFLPLQARYLMHHHQISEARRVLVELQNILHGLGFEKACDKVQLQIDRLDMA